MNKLFIFLFKYPIVNGLLVSLTMYLSIYTFVVPIFLGIYFCGILEFFIRLFFEDLPNKLISNYVIYLSLYLLFSTLIFNSIIYQRNISKKIYLLIILFQICLIETICFNWYWGEAIQYRNDGQLIFIIFESFKFAHYIFIPFYVIQQFFYFIPFHKFSIKKITSENRPIHEFENKVYLLSKNYENHTNDELIKIIDTEGWTNEAKTAAKLILEKRK